MRSRRDGLGEEEWMMVTLDVALGFMGGFLLFIGILIARIPVRCPHAGRCLRCEMEAEQQRLAQERLLAEMDHRWHVEAVEGCRRCAPKRDA